jgi:phosphoglycolate phosphatase
LTKKLKLIIFDLDGVLVDSRENMLLSWQKVQILFNIKIQFKSYFKNIGLPFGSILKKLGIKKKKN